MTTLERDKVSNGLFLAFNLPWVTGSALYEQNNSRGLLCSPPGAVSDDPGQMMLEELEKD
jgi:hypothetical protein